MFLPKVKSKIGEDISILIQLDNYSFNFICECGDASDLTVKECQNTEAIFISHTHIDHFINFDFILRHQLGIERRVIICGPKGITQQVQAKLRGYQWNLIEENAIIYEVREISCNDEIQQHEIKPPYWDIVKLTDKKLDGLYNNERFQVNFVILDHKTASIAYLFKEHDTVKIDLSQSEFKGGSWIRTLKTAFIEGNEELVLTIKDKAYRAKELFHLLHVKKGDTLGIIMDHAANSANHEKIKSLFSNCNKVFIESFYKKEDKELAKLNYHSFSEASAKIMKDCNVQTAIPVHFSRKYKAEEVKVLMQEFYNML